jgi:hypothetical protein
MSRFSGMNNNINQGCNRFAYNPFQQEVVFQRQNHWDFLRNNIDDIIKKSKLLQENEIKIVEEENSRCNEIETIYECVDEPEPVNANPIVEDVVVAPPPVEITAPLPVVEVPVDPPAKKRMDFASVVFKYRNQLASRKHKELQSSV